MDRDEEVGLHAPRLVHALVRAARSSRRRASAPRACWARRRCAPCSLRAIASVTSFSYVPRAADRARILAAVARVDRDDDRRAASRGLRGARRVVGVAARRSSPGPAARRLAASRVCALGCRASAISGSGGTSGIEVEHQAVPVFARPAPARTRRGFTSALRSNTTRTRRGLQRPTRTACDVRIGRAARAPASSRELGVERRRPRGRARGARDRAATEAGARAARATRASRACSPAPARRARDAMRDGLRRTRAARAAARPAAAATASARRRASAIADQRVPEAAGVRSRQRIAHRRRCVAASSQVAPVAASHARARSQVRRRQQLRDALRPFDQAHAVAA